MSNRISLENDSRQEPMDQETLIVIEHALKDIETTVADLDKIILKDVQLKSVLRYLVAYATVRSHEIFAIGPQYFATLIGYEREDLEYFCGLVESEASPERLSLQDFDKMSILEARYYAMAMMRDILRMDEKISIHGTEAERISVRGR